MKKICMVVFSAYPEDPRVRREAEALMRRGYAIDVFCCRMNYQEAEDVVNGVSVYRIMDTPEDKEHIVKYIFYTLKFTKKAFFAITKRDKIQNYDLFHTHNMPDYLIFACHVAFRKKKPVILDLHDLSVELLGSKMSGLKKQLLLPLVRLQEKAACNKAAALITTSIGFKDRLMQRGHSEEKITLVLNTADPDVFQYEANREFIKKDKDIHLIYHGTIASRFGLALIIEAINILRNQIPGICFELYGRYEITYKKVLEDLVRKYDLYDNVILGGWKPREEIAEIIKRIDFAVVPYLYDEFMNLATSTKTYEYAIAGIPIIASRLDSITSLFSDEAVTYFNPGDYRDLADKILLLSQDPETQRKQNIKAYEAQKGISYDIMAGRLYNLVDSLIK